MSEPATTAAPALYSVDAHARRVPVALRGVAVEAGIRDYASRTTVTHRYRNEEDPAYATLFDMAAPVACAAPLDLDEDVTRMASADESGAFGEPPRAEGFEEPAPGADSAPRRRARSGSQSALDVAHAAHERPLDRLVRLQRADGAWDLAPELAGILGLEEAEMADPLGDAALDDQARRAWATRLALAWLDAHAAEAEDEWRWLAAKARVWLRLADARLTVPVPDEAAARSLV